MDCDVRLIRLLVSTILLLVATPLVAPDHAAGATPAGPVFVTPDGCVSPTLDSKGLPTDSQAGALERDDDATNVPLDGTIIISPPVFEFDSPIPGDTVLACTLVIRNRASEPMTLQVVPLGMIGSSNPGTGGREYFDAADERFDSSAGAWIEPVVDEVNIRPRGVARVPFEVRVPLDAPGGAAYGAIGVLSRSGAADVGANVGVETVRAASILLRLSGDAQPRLRFEDVRAPRLRIDRKAWRLTARIANDGNLHATSSRGRVRVRSIFGNEVASLALPERRLLPGSSDPIEASWEHVPWIGLYRWDARTEAASGIKDDDSPVVATAAGWFVALPPWWVPVTLAVVIGLLAAAHQRRRRRGHS